MFRNTFQAGLLSIFYSLGSKPLQLWRVCQSDAASIQVVLDADIRSAVYELQADNISQVYMSCPAEPSQTLGIKLPIVVLVVKNIDRYFSFEVEVMDDKRVKRRFRVSNYQTEVRVTDAICTMPLRLDPGWNQVQLNLADLVRRAYGSGFVETLSVTVHANCRLRRVYFADKPKTEEELPTEFKLYLPIANA